MLCSAQSDKLQRIFYQGTSQQQKSQDRVKIIREMFKIKQSKRSTSTLGSINVDNKVSEKRIQLNQNNDFINIHSYEHLHDNQQYLTTMNKNNQLKKTLLRPKSGLNRNLDKVCSIKYQLNDQQLIQQKIKQKAINKLLRPSTSTNINENNNNIGKDKKHNRLINRKGTINSSTNLPPKSMKILSNHNIQSQNIENNNQISYVSNQQVLEIMLNILDRQQEYMRLRQVSQEQFERIKQKLVSNISIILLKWYKILQDRLYNQVKTITRQSTQQKQLKQQTQQTKQKKQNQQNPQTLQQLISKQIKKHFVKSYGLFTIQQRCNSQQSRLQQLIDGRLNKLSNLLTLQIANI